MFQKYLIACSNCLPLFCLMSWILWRVCTSTHIFRSRSKFQIRKMCTICCLILNNCKDFVAKANILRTFFEQVFRFSLFYIKAEERVELLSKNSIHLIAHYVMRGISVHADNDLKTNQYHKLNWRHVYIYSSNFNKWLKIMGLGQKKYLSPVAPKIERCFAYVEYLEREDAYFGLQMPVILMRASESNLSAEELAKQRLLHGNLPLQSIPPAYRVAPSRSTALYETLETSPLKKIRNGLALPAATALVNTSIHAPTPVYKPEGLSSESPTATNPLLHVKVANCEANK